MHGEACAWPGLRVKYSALPKSSPDGSQGLLLQYEIWKYFQSTGNVCFLRARECSIAH